MPVYGSKTKKRAGKRKPLLLTFLTIAIVVLSALAPKLLLSWEDATRIGQYAPLQQTGGALLSNASYYYRDVVSDTPFSGDEEVTRVDAPDEMQAIVDSSILGQLTEMTDAGVIPGEIASHTRTLLSRQDLDMEIRQSVGDTHIRDAIFIIPSGHNSIERFSATLDASTGKMVTYTIGLRDAIPLDIELAALFGNYVSWLEMGDITDWEITQQSESDNISESMAEYTAYSASAGTQISITYMQSENVTELHINITAL